MLGKTGSEEAPAAHEEKELNLIHAISKELTHVPEQKQPLHPSAVSADMEGTQSFNSLPEIALSGSNKSSKWEQEDGVIRSGTAFLKIFLVEFGPIIGTGTDDHVVIHDIIGQVEIGNFGANQDIAACIICPQYACISSPVTLILHPN